MSNVDFQHPQYDENVADWQKVSDFIKGEKAIKAKGELYLKKHLKATKERYDNYLDGAYYFNVAARTKEALKGAVFRKDPSIDISSVPQLEYIKSDCDGNNLSLTQLAKDAVDHNLENGRLGLLVDFPVSDSNRSKADDMLFKYRANINLYDAESIINWRTISIGGGKKLRLVVLKESYDDYKDEFKFENKDQWRVLKLDEDGYYVQEVYRDEQLYQTFDNIRDNSGNRLDYIPFVFIGSKNNDANVDPIPLLDLVNISKSHYKNSADIEEMSHFLGQPFLTYYEGNTSPADKKEIVKQDISIGSSKAWRLGANYKVDFHQIQESNLPSNLAATKIEHMIMQGARLITSQADNETATAAMARTDAEVSVLHNIASNVSDGIRKALVYAARFNLGKGNFDEDEIKYKLNDEFFSKPADPAVIMAQIQLFDRGLTSMQAVRERLRSMDEIPPQFDDETLDDQINNQGY